MKGGVSPEQVLESIPFERAGEYSERLFDGGGGGPLLQGRASLGWKQVVHRTSSARSRAWRRDNDDDDDEAMTTDEVSDNSTIELDDVESLR